MADNTEDNEEYQVEEIYVDPNTGQTIIYDTDDKQHIVEKDG